MGSLSWKVASQGLNPDLLLHLESITPRQTSQQGRGAGSQEQTDIWQETSCLFSGSQGLVLQVGSARLAMQQLPMLCGLWWVWPGSTNSASRAGCAVGGWQRASGLSQQWCCSAEPSWASASVYLWGVSAKMLRPGGLWYSPWPTSLLPSWCCCMDESWYLLMLDLPGPVLTAPHGALTAMPWRRDLYYSQSVDQETRALVSKNGILAWLMKLCHLFTVWICLQFRRPGFNPWVGKIPWKREWQPATVFLFLFF